MNRRWLFVKMTHGRCRHSSTMLLPNRRHCEAIIGSHNSGLVWCTLCRLSHVAFLHICWCPLHVLRCDPVESTVVNRAHRVLHLLPFVLSHTVRAVCCAVACLHQQPRRAVRTDAVSACVRAACGGGGYLRGARWQDHTQAWHARIWQRA